MKKSLPTLKEIIYQLENLNPEDDFWLDIDKGCLTNFIPEYQDISGLFGLHLFPLPPWSSKQGYHMMQEFALKYEHETQHSELLKILRSRHQVFRRYRSYLKKYSQLNNSWKSFKEHYFCQYLQTWYAEEFPQARELLALLHDLKPQKESSNEAIPNTFQRSNYYWHYPEEETEISLTESLIREDFEIHEILQESAVHFLQLHHTEKELRAFAIANLNTEIRAETTETQAPEFCHLRILCNHITWFNRLELTSPAGDYVACLYWGWHKSDPLQARFILCTCREEYKALKPKNYLLDYFLYELCPKYGIQSVEFYLNHTLEQEYADVLASKNLEERGRVYCIQISH